MKERCGSVKQAHTDKERKKREKEREREREDLVIYCIPLFSSSHKSRGENRRRSKRRKQLH